MQQRIYNFKVMMVVLVSTLLTVLLLANDSHARKKNRKFPRGCQTVGFEFKNQQLVLAPAQEEYDQTIYFIKNVSPKTIFLKYYPTGNDFINPTWQTVVKSQRWAAFATDLKNTHFACSVIKRGNQFTPTDCGHVLELCQFPRAKFASHNMGNYWISENNSQNGAVRDAIRKGILLRW